MQISFLIKPTLIILSKFEIKLYKGYLLTDVEVNGNIIESQFLTTVMKESLMILLVKIG